MTGLKRDQVAGAVKLRSLARRIVRAVRSEQVAGAATDGERVAPLHLSVLDGQTLNVSVELEGGADYRVGVLELVSDDVVMDLPMTLVHSAYGPSRLDLCVPLSVQGTGHYQADGIAHVPLAVGRWRLRLRLTDSAGLERRLSLLAVPESLAAGPTKGNPQSPRLGAHLRLDATKDGRALLRATPIPACGEVSRVQLGWTGVVVRGQGVGIPAEGRRSVRAEAVRRQDERVEPAELTWEQDRFSFAVPVDRLLDGVPGEQIWDLRLQGAAGVLRLGRRLTDVREPKQVFKMPYQLIETSDGRTVRVHAYYTQGGSLCLSCALI